MKKEKAVSKRTSKLRKPLRSAEVPATAEMLYEMEERLNHRMDAGFKQVDAKFKGLESKFMGLESRFEGLESKMSEMKSEFHRVALLVEEQNARNKYVMDGYAQLYRLIETRLMASP